jgi:hypothetical protein
MSNTQPTMSTAVMETLRWQPAPPLRPGPEMAALKYLFRLHKT